MNEIIFSILTFVLGLIIGIVAIYIINNIKNKTDNFFQLAARLFSFKKDIVNFQYCFIKPIYLKFWKHRVDVFKIKLRILFHKIDIKKHPDTHSGQNKMLIQMVNSVNIYIAVCKFRKKALTIRILIT